MWRRTCGGSAWNSRGHLPSARAAPHIYSSAQILPGRRQPPPQSPLWRPTGCVPQASWRRLRSLAVPGPLRLHATSLRELLPPPACAAQPPPLLFRLYCVPLHSPPCAAVPVTWRTASVLSPCLVPGASLRLFVRCRPPRAGAASLRPRWPPRPPPRLPHTHTPAPLGCRSRSRTLARPRST